MDRIRALLTSAGILNQSLRDALRQLVGRPFAEASVVLVATAATAQPGDHGWLVDDINRVYALGWREFNVLELGGLPRQVVLRRLGDADVIYAEGGNAYHLADLITKVDLAGELVEMLHRKVYVGASAGSMILTRRLTDRLTTLFGTGDELYRLNHRTPVSPLDLFDWFVHPHTNPATWDREAAGRLDCPVYAIDDQTAVRVVNGTVDVVSEGWWELTGAPPPAAVG